MGGYRNEINKYMVARHDYIYMNYSGLKKALEILVSTLTKGPIANTKESSI